MYTWDLSSRATIRVLRGGASSWPNKSFLLPRVSHCASWVEDIISCEWRNSYHKRRSEKWHISSGIIALCVSVAHFSFTMMLCCTPMTDSCFTCKGLSLVGSISRLPELKTWEAETVEAEGWVGASGVLLWKMFTLCFWSEGATGLHEDSQHPLGFGDLQPAPLPKEHDAEHF